MATVNKLIEIELLSKYAATSIKEHSPYIYLANFMPEDFPNEYSRSTTIKIKRPYPIISQAKVGSFTAVGEEIPYYEQEKAPSYVPVSNRWVANATEMTFFAHLTAAKRGPMNENRVVNFISEQYRVGISAIRTKITMMLRSFLGRSAYIAVGTTDRKKWNQLWNNLRTAKSYILERNCGSLSFDNFNVIVPEMAVKVVQAALSSYSQAEAAMTPVGKVSSLKRIEVTSSGLTIYNDILLADQHTAGKASTMDDIKIKTKVTSGNVITLTGLKESEKDVLRRGDILEVSGLNWYNSLGQETAVPMTLVVNGKPGEGNVIDPATASTIDADDTGDVQVQISPRIITDKSLPWRNVSESGIPAETKVTVVGNHRKGFILDRYSLLFDLIPPADGIDRGKYVKLRSDAGGMYSRPLSFRYTMEDDNSTTDRLTRSILDAYVGYECWEDFMAQVYMPIDEPFGEDALPQVTVNTRSA